jgi:hypothetical protein
VTAPTRPRPSHRRASPLVYSAVVFPSGEIPAIHETLGRRRLRVIDPASAEGRRLLAARQVRLRVDPAGATETLPVGTLFRRLERRARADHARHAGRAGWDASCRARLAALDRWAEAYGRKTTRDH